ncbi:fatty acyl-AMP ligase [Nocardia sp. NBC_01503]|uniref:fatty acyl-AMP ligase n=1 Tax=Nocardia sp. NBC_01503 TaxID=2975997 RepID=UPI002E7BD6E4|nr:fatty acyl-AMP ligase [Nocardia sp. NBC_01503]WTL32191.1 fatty acyl-AMP ligase [Nocardia sp. NBC_01503]
MRQPTLLPDILRRRAVQETDRTAYIFLDDNGAETSTLTYGELHARALSVAAELETRCAPGDRALLVFPQCPEFIVAWFGCLYAGVIAVPVHPPRRARVQEATVSIVRDCVPVAVLSLDMFLAPLRTVLGPYCAAPHWLAVDGMSTAGVEFEPVARTVDDLAFLQYTSGSTSAPKGVMVTHGNLMANEEMIRQGFGHDRDSTVVGWAPFFHDQGLIGNVLQPLYVGATSVLMSPTAFIRRPLLWLSTISRYRAHTSGGPNFAFDACVRRAAAGPLPELDLSSWRVAFNGAEPIRPGTLRAFTETFAAYGFSAGAWYPCYGLAEATLLVAGSPVGRGPRLLELDSDALGERRYAVGGRTKTLVGSGQVLAGEQVRIVDPDTGVSCPPDRVGEIWVAGNHIAQGYWRNETATAASFRSDGFLRTGDLGLLVDGELYVVGRVKDLVVIRGRNYYPQDIEHTAQTAHPALRAGACAAFAIDAPGGERLVLVQEIRRDAEGDPADITGAIKAAVTAEHELALADVVLAAPGQVQRTSSGKIMRSAARNRYLAGEFEVWTSAADDHTRASRS